MFIAENLNKLVNNYLVEAKADWDNLSAYLTAYGDLGTKAIETFKKFKDRLKGQERDIYYWVKQDDPEAFIYRMNELRNTKSKTQLDKDARQRGSELVAENDDWKVYKITNHEASCQLGKGTKWCITMDTPEYWDGYAQEDYAFYFFIRKKPRGDNFDKIALQYDADSNFVAEFW